MRILQLNLTYKSGSTGKIMADLDTVISENGYDSYMLCGYSTIKKANLFVVPDIFKQPYANLKNILRMRLTGRNGYTHKKATIKAIEWIRQIDPDIIHLHNIHGNWIFLPKLFNFLQSFGKPIIWTLHDCWSFTGRCSHFELSGCDKWKSNCHNCKNKSVYPISYFFDFSRSMHLDKKKWYSNLDNLTIVTPSNWLAKYVEKSFLGHNPIITIHNGIDLGTFYPRKELSKYLPRNDKKIVLGVANSWSEKKGLLDFIKIDQILDHDRYQIVLVGVSKKQMQNIPSTIVCIERTDNQNELAEIYSNAYVFINPTYQDNYPTTNMEAMACGCPVISYNTGGSPESLPDDSFVVEKGNYQEIADIINERLFNDNLRINICEFAKRHDKFTCFSQYVKLYIDLFERRRDK